jgi:hypothetical protein
MVIALVVLSLAMIGGGAFAAFQGWEIVLVERGWTLMIAGSTVAASGALLLGVSAVAARLGRIRSELEQIRERSGQLGHAPAPPSFDPLPGLSPSLLDGGGTVAPAGPAPDDEVQPPLPLFMRPSEDEAAPRPGPEPKAAEPERAEAKDSDEAPDVRLPEYLFRSRDPEPERGSRARNGSGPSAAVAPVREPAWAEVRDARKASAPEPAMASPEPEPAPAPAEPEALPAPAAPETSATATIIGTYTSGDNRYVMYSDGSIQADTPQGVFRFGSLDELKEFIASGGEAGASAT